MSRPKVDQLWYSVASDLQIPFDALAFVYKAFDYTHDERSGSSEQTLRHCSASEFSNAFVQLAKDSFGERYVSYLRSWELDTSERLGRVVYLLIDRGLLGREESDHRNDFDGQFDFSKVKLQKAELPRHEPFVESLPPIAQPTAGTVILVGFAVLAIFYGVVLLAEKLSIIFDPVPVAGIVYTLLFGILWLTSLRKSRIRYSVRTLLIVMTLVAVVLGIIALAK